MKRNSNKKHCRIISVFIALAMLASLIPITASASKWGTGTEDDPYIAAIRFADEKGVYMTEVSSSDSVTLKVCPTVYDKTPIIGSVFLEEANSGESYYLYLEQGAGSWNSRESTYYISLDGLYTGEYDVNTNTEYRGEAIPPGLYYIVCYDDGNKIPVTNQWGTYDTAIKYKSESNVTVKGGKPRLTITTQSLADATVGEAYSAALSATTESGGTLTWSVSSGALPDGLTLSSGGVISGTPKMEGLSSFTVSVRESNGSVASKTLRISVGRAPIVKAINSCGAYFLEDAYGIKRGSSFFAFLYTNINAVSAGVTLYYNNGQTREYSYYGSGTAFTERFELPDDAQSIEKLVFKADELTREYAVNKQVASEIKVSFSGVLPYGDSATLHMQNENKVMAWQIYNTEPMTLSLPSGTYTADVVVYSQGCALTAGKVENIVVAAGASREINIELSGSIISVAPYVTANNSPAPAGSYRLDWYKNTLLIATGSAYTMPDNETGVKVKAVPLGEYTTLYKESELTDVTGASVWVNMLPIEKSIVSGTVTRPAYYDGENGASYPVAGATVTVTNRGDNGYAKSYTTYTDEDGKFEFDEVANNGATLIISGAEITSYSQTLWSGYMSNLDIVVQPISASTIYLDSYVNRVVVKKSDGTVVPTSMWGGKVTLDSDVVAAGETLTVFAYRGGWNGWYGEYMEKNVTLNAKKSANLETKFTTCGQAVFNIVNNGKKLSAFALYDSEGSLIRTDEKQLYAEAEYTYPVQMPAGNYTAIFVANRDVWKLIGANSRENLDTLKAELDNLGDDLYAEQSIAIEDEKNGSYDINLADTKLGEQPIDLTNSGIVVRNDAAYMHYRATVAKGDAPLADENKLSVVFYTNQITDSNKTPLIVPGSLYINGKRPVGNDSVYDVFTKGTYIVSIDDVEKYGGYPISVSFNAERVVSSRIKVSSYAVFDSNVQNPSNYNNYRIGDAEITKPAISFYAPELTSQKSFSVYGYASAEATVSIMRDGIKISEVKADKNGYYLAQIDLGDMREYTRSTLSAIAESDGIVTSSAKTVVLYSSDMPTLEKIEFTDMYDKWHTCWDNGSVSNAGYYVYNPSAPMKFRLTFSNADSEDDVEDVYVYIPRSSGTEMLEAKYIGGGRWETDGYMIGNVAPTGAWASYSPTIPNAGINASDDELNQKLEWDNLSTWDIKGASADEIAAMKATLANLGITIDETVTEGIAATYDGVRITSVSSKDPADVAAAVADIPIIEFRDSSTKENRDYNIALGEEGYEYPEGENFIYHRCYENEGVYTIDEAYKFPYENSSYAVYARVISTVNSCTQIMMDTKYNRMTTLTYSRVSPVEEITGNRYKKSATIVAAWQGYASDLYALTESIGTGGAANLSSLSDNSVTLFGDSDPVKDAESAIKSINEYGEIEALARLLYVVKNNGGGDAANDNPYSDVQRSGFSEYCMSGNNYKYNTTGRIHDGIDYRITKKWGEKVGNKLLSEIGDNAKNLAEAAATGGVATVAKKGAESLWNNIWQSLAGKALSKADQKLAQEDARELYDAMISYEKETGMHLNWDGFPFTKDMPDPRARQDDDDEKKKASGGGGGSDEEEGSGGESSGGSGGTSTGGTGGSSVPVETGTGACDPSGFVYEAVPSNRLEGVTATCYTVSDAGERAKWDAEAFGQTNPQTSDSDGIYQWFVPEGKWSVIFTKRGYETYITGENDGIGAEKIEGTDVYYMPVPPEQLDVNIGMVSRLAPWVSNVEVIDGEGVYIAFNKYMDETTLIPNNFTLLDSEGNNVDFTIVKEDSETGADGETSYTRKVKLSAPDVKQNDTYKIYVSASVRSYAGTAMKDMYESWGLRAESIPLTTPEITMSETSDKSAWRFDVTVERVYTDSKVYAVSYDEYGKLIKLSTADINSKDTKITLDKTKNTDKVKIFVWKDTMTPVTNAVEYEIK